MNAAPKRPVPGGLEKIAITRNIDAWYVFWVKTDKEPQTEAALTKDFCG